MALKLVMVLVLSLFAFATGGKLPRTVPMVTFEPPTGMYKKMCRFSKQCLKSEFHTKLCPEITKGLIIIRKLNCLVFFLIK